MPKFQFSGNIWFITTFERGHRHAPRARATSEKGGYELAIFATFRLINHRISEAVQDRTMVAVDH